MISSTNDRNIGPEICSFLDASNTQPWHRIFASDLAVTGCAASGLPECGCIRFYMGLCIRSSYSSPSEKAS